MLMLYTRTCTYALIFESNYNKFELRQYKLMCIYTYVVVF